MRKVVPLAFSRRALFRFTRTIAAMIGRWCLTLASAATFHHKIGHSLIEFYFEKQLFETPESEECDNAIVFFLSFNYIR